MGVRYNAEKTKLGNYYSTPVYLFKMKCHLCDNYFEIKTDPQNLDYEIVSGARRQENRWDPTQNGQIVPETKETQRKLFDDAMYKLEHVAKDVEKSDSSRPIQLLTRLYNKSDVWRDCYEANSILRSKFREQKKELKAKDEKDKSLLVKASLDIPLLEENETDKQLAAMMKFNSSRSFEENSTLKLEKILNQPILPTSSNSVKLKRKANETLMKSDLKKINLGIVRKTAEGKGDSKPASKLCNYSSSSSETE